jgi:hypothetical protein
MLELQLMSCNIAVRGDIEEGIYTLFPSECFEMSLQKENMQSLANNLISNGIP